MAGEVWMGDRGQIVRVLEASASAVEVRGLENAHHWNRIALGPFLRSYRPATPAEMDWIAEL